MKHTLRIFTTILAFILLLPIAQAEVVVTGIELSPSINAIGIRWQTPSGVEIDRYKVYFSKESILENNGRYLGSEETIGNQTSLALFDLTNRGFSSDDRIVVAVTVIDTVGKEHLTFTEEVSADVQMESKSPLHQSTSVYLENAVAENETTVRLVFSGPVIKPEGHPATHFTIIDEAEGVVHVLSATAQNNSMLLRTSPMTVRASYTLTIKETLKSVDGSAIDPAKNSTTFIARSSGDPIESITDPTTTEPNKPNQPNKPNKPTTSQPTEPTPEPDTTPPEDATRLTLEHVLQTDGNYTVHAKWKASPDTANDLAAYHLYESDDKGSTFVGPTALLGTVLSTAIANIPPGTFTLKISAVDENSNASNGIMETIILPETGAATLLLSFGGAAIFALRRNRKRLLKRT